MENVRLGGARHHQRRASEEKVRAGLAGSGKLPVDPQKARRAVAAQLDERVCQVGMTPVSRAVSELVRAGLLKRHYQGDLADHENRGAQRHAVYTLTPQVMAALRPDNLTSETGRAAYRRFVGLVAD